jgi:GntR family transcriptional regulator
MTETKRGLAFDLVSMDNMPAVDANSPLPLYFQICKIIERKIETKQWHPGQALPAEQIFCETFALSRTVVRQAFSELENKGLIKKRNGKHSTIAFPSYHGGLMQSLRGFHEDASSRGQETSTRVLDFKVVPADRDVAYHLDLQEREPVVMLNRLRFLSGEPEVLVVTYLPLQRCPEILSFDFSSRSLYEVLDREFGLRIAKGIRRIQAIALDKADSRLLGVKSGSPALLLTSVGLLSDGSPLEYFIAKHRGDRSQFEVQLVG